MEDLHDPESNTDGPADRAMDDISSINPSVSANGNNNTGQEINDSALKLEELISLDQHPCVKKRKSYANSFKLEAIELAEKIGNRKAAKELGLDESNVREWRKRKLDIEKLPTHKRTKRHTKPKWAELEAQLAQWYLDRKSRNLYLTTNMVKEKGMELAMVYGYIDFTGSSGWVTRFMNRVRDGASYLNVNRSGQRSGIQLQPHIPPECVERVQTFRSFFAEKRAQSELKRRNGIISLDEVPISLDMPSVEGHNAPFRNQQQHQHGGPHSTNPPESDNSIIPPAEKVKFTVVLSASAAGGKLPPLVIFKGKNLPKEAAFAFPDGVVVRANDRGWITPNLVDDWIENCWKKWLWPSRSEDNVLIIDSCKSHRTQEFKFKISKYFQTTLIPQGMSSLLQPLELTATKSFKENVLRQWEHWVLDQACGAEEDDEGSYSKKIINYIMICNWVLEAWKDVNPQGIMNGFAKAGIESFSPEEVVEAILSESGDHSEQDTLSQSNNNQVSLFPDDENLVGDEFDGWE